MLRSTSRVLPTVLRSTCTVQTAAFQRARHYATAAAEAEKKPSAPVPPHIATIVDQISKLNILEVSDLVKALQEKLGLSGAVPMMGGAAPAAAPAAAAPPPPKEEVKEKEKTEFTVKLMKVAENAKYKIIKELREIKPTLSLMETKSLVEKTPSTLLEKVSKEEAQKVIQKLKDAGGDCEMV